MGLSFTIAAGARQRSHSHVRAPQDLWPHLTVSGSRLPQPGGPGSRIHIPPEQGGPVIPPDTGFPFRRLLQLAGLRWRYSNPPPHGISAKSWAWVSLILRPTVGRPVSLGIKHSSGAYDKIFITVRHLRVCWCGTLFLTRGRICRLQLLLVLASAVIFGSESHGTHDHILPSQIRDFPFRRLRFAGLLWRY
jgi:hypothetical protein